MSIQFYLSQVLEQFSYTESWNRPANVIRIEKCFKVFSTVVTGLIADRTNLAELPKRFASLASFRILEFRPVVDRQFYFSFVKELSYVLACLYGHVSNIKERF